MKKFKKQTSILFLLAAICGFNISNSNISNVANAQENNNAQNENNKNDEVNEEQKQAIMQILLEDPVILKDTGDTVKDNVRIYIHPFTLVPTSLYWMLFDETEFVMIHLTFEKPLNLSSSLIIKPSFWNLMDFRDVAKIFKIEHQDDGWNFDFGSDYIHSAILYRQLRVGSDFGIRYYFNRKSEGFYFQGQVGTFYYRTTSEVHDADNNRINYKSKNGLWLDVMGYVGHSWKKLFVDFGLGYRKIPHKNFNMRNIFFDINFGFGGIVE